MTENPRAAAVEAAERLDAAYLERNRVVALLSKLFPAGTKRSVIDGWDPEWLGCVYIDLPTGQASWHFHDRDAHLFAHLPEYAGEWDGHTTDEKYARLARMAEAGWVVVPREATDEMADAGRRAGIPAVLIDSISGRERMELKARYTAMVRAAMLAHGDHTNDPPRADGEG